MRNFTFLLLGYLLHVHSVCAQSPTNRFTISGYVREADSQEALPSVNVYVSRPVAGAQIGTTTNTFGFFSLTLPGSDSLSLTFSSVGYDAATRAVLLRKNITLNVLLTPGRTLAEVDVRGNRPDEKFRNYLKTLWA